MITVRATLSEPPLPPAGDQARAASTRACTRCATIRRPSSSPSASTCAPSPDASATAAGALRHSRSTRHGPTKQTTERQQQWRDHARAGGPATSATRTVRGDRRRTAIRGGGAADTRHERVVAAGTPGRPPRARRCVAVLLLPSLLSVFGSWRSLSHLDWPFAILAFACEIASYLCLWEVDRIVLGTRAWFTVAAAQLIGFAAAHVLPGGGATSTAVTTSVLRKAGVADTGQIVTRSAQPPSCRWQRPSPCPCSRYQRSSAARRSTTAWRMLPTSAPPYSWHSWQRVRPPSLATRQPNWPAARFSGSSTRPSGDTSTLPTFRSGCSRIATSSARRPAGTGRRHCRRPWATPLRLPRPACRTSRGRSRPATVARRPRVRRGSSWRCCPSLPAGLGLVEAAHVASYAGRNLSTPGRKPPDLVIRARLLGSYSRDRLPHRGRTGRVLHPVAGEVR